MTEFLIPPESTNAYYRMLSPTGAAEFYFIQEAPPATPQSHPADEIFKALRKRMPLERTDALLEEILRLAKPKEILARLNDQTEAAAARARLVTLVPRLRGSLSDADIVAALAPLAKHLESEVRYVVAEALADFPGQESAQILRFLLNDPVSTIRDVAQESLAVVE